MQLRFLGGCLCVHPSIYMIMQYIILKQYIHTSPPMLPKWLPTGDYVPRWSSPVAVIFLVPYSTLIFTASFILWWLGNINVWPSRNPFYEFTVVSSWMEIWLYYNPNWFRPISNSDLFHLKLRVIPQYWLNSASSKSTRPLLTTAAFLIVNKLSYRVFCLIDGFHLW